MSVTPKFSGRVEGGRVLMEGQIKDTFDGYLKTMEGEEVFVVVRKPGKDYPQRSSQQNRYYWKQVVGIPAEEYGYLPEEMHDAFKLIFLRMDEEGKPKTIKSTTALTTVEFSEYVEKCAQWCAEHGIYVPPPNEIDG